jgi:hypothetical protein
MTETVCNGCDGNGKYMAQVCCGNYKVYGCCGNASAEVFTCELCGGTGTIMAESLYPNPPIAGTDEGK